MQDNLLLAIECQGNLFDIWDILLCVEVNCSVEWLATCKRRVLIELNLDERVHVCSPQLLIVVTKHFPY